MNPDFWRQCWESNSIGFHETQPNVLLTSYFDSCLKDMNKQRVFVPMCGKSNDMTWLIKQNIHVIGVELSEIAVNAYFKSLNITPTITKTTYFQKYSSSFCDIFVGDLFNLTPNDIETIDVIYDRAALIAWEPTQRQKYCNFLIKITKNAPQLIITFQAPSNQEALVSQGPPFFIQPETIQTLYSENYSSIKLIHSHQSERLIHSAHPNECLWKLQA